MPDKFESHASVQGFHQNFKLYGTDQASIGNHQTASFGNKVNDLSFWFGVDRLENRGQPLDFSVKNASDTGGSSGRQVTGVYQDISEKNAQRLVFGATNITDSTQTNIKFKAAYDLPNKTKLNYTIGIWDLESKTDVQSYIKDEATGNSIFAGQVSSNGKDYKVGAMNPAKGEALHIMQALDFKSDTKGFYDWQFTLSNYNYSKDLSNSADLTTNTQNPYTQNIAGKLTDQNGTGWTIFDARATLRPKDHSIDIGYHIDGYQLRSTTNSTADWTVNQKLVLSADSKGNTQTQALYIQDKWQFSPLWSLTLGARQEFWEAYEGQNYSNTKFVNYADKSDSKFSPKASLNYEPVPAWGFRAAFGKAYRFPTVNELYQQLTSGTNAIQNNPDLKPEKIFSAEFTAERRFLNGLVRVSFFNEHKYDALLSQTTAVTTNCPSAGVGKEQCTYIQNVDHIRTYGAELSTQWQNLFISGLDLNANATFTDGKVLQDILAPTYVGKNAPRLPKQLYKAVATYHVDNNLTLSLAGRYSGRQYINLDNSDTNPETYKAASQFLFVDAKVNYKLKDRWTASLGVDNIFNDQAYVSHPYPQRTGYAQIKFDY